MASAKQGPLSKVGSGGGAVFGTDGPPTQQELNMAARTGAVPMDGPEYRDLISQLSATRATAAKQQQGGIDGQRQVLSEQQARSKNQQVDLSPLMSLTDTWTGSNLAQGYNRPTSVEDNASMTNQLQQGLQKSMGALTKGEQDYLETMLKYSQKATDADLMAQLGQEKLDSNEKIAAGKASAALAKNGGLNQTPGQRTLDTDFAREYNDWTSGGESDAVSQVELLKKARDELFARPDDSSISGKMELAKDKVGGEMLRNPDSIKLQQAVQSVTAEGLKASLGSSFTEKDREFMTSMSYNLGLSPKENAGRVARVIDKIEQRIASKKAKAEEFRRGKGTLQDYVPAAAPVQAKAPAAAPAQAKPSKVIQNGVEYTLNPATGEYE
jgi:hypothetical protein